MSEPALGGAFVAGVALVSVSGYAHRTLNPRRKAKKKKKKKTAMGRRRSKM